MSEKYWGKVFGIDSLIFKYRAELYENEELDDAMSIAKLIARKKFFTSYSAKKWVEKKIINEYDIIFIKDFEIVRRNWNG